MYNVNIASGYAHEEALFVSLDDLRNIFNLLDEGNDLEEEIRICLMKYFYFQVWKNRKNQTLNILKKCTVTRGSFELFQVCFIV